MDRVFPLTHKNQVNIKYTTNILHFQAEARKQNLPSPKQHKRRTNLATCPVLVAGAGLEPTTSGL